MAWVTHEEVLAVYPETADEDADRFAALIDHVQALAEVAVGTQATPSARLKAVFTDVVYRKWLAITQNPDGVQSELLGSYQYMQPNAPGLGLTKHDRKNLKAAVGRIGVWVQPVHRGEVETAPREDGFLEGDLL